MVTRVTASKVDTVKEESALVERAAAGDFNVFGELYQRHLGAIYRYIYFKVGNVEDAEDLTEQVFLKAWEALPGYQHCGFPFTSWLYRIARNLTIDYHRRKISNLDSPLPADRVNESKQPAILEQVIREEETSLLATAIAKLPEEQQQVIVLRFIEGLRHAEVAEILGKSEGACRVIQYQAIQALHQLLEGMRGM
jgi:RNA polymerase sigma-70 factor (ECF subfamily)